MKQWILSGKEGPESLRLVDVPTPEPGDYEVLIKIHAASLNYRDIAISKGAYYSPIKSDIVPGSDAAGEVVKLGHKVSRFQVGDRVCPLFFQTHLYGSVTPESLSSQLGSQEHGVFREYAVYNEQGCIKVPDNLTYREASTLPCAALTAWNSLYGGPKQLLPGNTVLTQGTGGVSIFALQFAVSGGAQVIPTTSSASKSTRLQEQGAHAVINYKDDKEWGTTAKSLSTSGKGADFVVEIGGPNAITQSHSAIKHDGQIAVVGARGGVEGSGNSGPAHGTTMATTRRIMIGNRQQFEHMNAAVQVNDIKPVIDEARFNFDGLKDAYNYLPEGKHYGKVVVDFVASKPE